MPWLILLLCSFGCAILGRAQDSTRFTFQFYVDREPLHPGIPFTCSGMSDSMTIESCKFYVSGWSLWRRGRLVFANKQPVLIDLETKNQIACAYIGSFDQIQFRVGLDSVAHQVADFSGDLDPLLGMYWAWQSGFIFFKLEGFNQSCATPHHWMAYHLGGYRAPNPCMQSLTLTVDGGHDVQIGVDISVLLRATGIPCEVMSPGPVAKSLCDKIPKMFTVR